MFSIESRKNKAIFKKRIVNVVVRTFDFHKIVKSDIRQYLSFAAMFQHYYTILPTLQYIIFPPQISLIELCGFALKIHNDVIDRFAVKR